MVHNHYRHKGGEDTVVEAELQLLRSRGVEATLYARNNDDIGAMPRLSLLADTFWSTRTTHDLESFIGARRPDVIHVHNTFPLISPSIYWVADRHHIPVVQTLHNFRLLCPQAMFLREEKVCESCLGRIPWRGVVRKCYRESLGQTAVLAGMVTTHRMLHTWRDKVTRYIALNEFCRRKFIEGGLPAERILIKPNFVDFPRPKDGARHGFLFVGRLSKEKGVDVLKRAVAELDAPALRVAGSGPEEALLSGVDGVVPLGALPVDLVRQEMAAASALILPSIWYENFPRTLVEAFGCGLPVIASRIGALADLVEDGVTGILFNPGDHLDLARRLEWAMAHPEELARMGNNARRHYEENFTADRNFAQLMAIYDQAIQERTST